MKKLIEKISLLLAKTIYRQLFFQNQQLLKQGETQNLLIGKQLSNELKKKGILDKIADAEFKVFSQWGDDGIIQYLIQNIEIEHEFFVEFGVENYTEANTHFLMMNNNWSGLIMDGSEKHMNYVKSHEMYWKYDLKAKNIFITAENINDLLHDEVPGKNIGLLHIDIDGNDYWVWKALMVVEPDIVIMEYNSLFGAKRPVTISYQADFYRSTAHYSNIRYGSSLRSLCDLAEEKGYYFVGSNSAGNDAFFVKKSKIGKLKPITCAEGYVTSKFKEARDEQGNVTFLEHEEAVESMRGFEVVNTKTGKTEVF